MPLWSAFVAINDWGGGGGVGVRGFCDREGGVDEGKTGWLTVFEVFGCDP